MSLLHYNDVLNNDWKTDDPVPSDEFNTIVGVIDTQLVGALQGLGVGCVETDAWEVTAGAGLSVDIAAGAGVAVSGDDYLFLATTASYNLSLDANSTTVIYARAVTRTVDGDPDSRTEAVVEWHTSTTGGTVAGALQVATVTTNADGVADISDDRSFIRALEALASLSSDSDAMDAVQEAIGSEYFGDDPPASSLDARIDDIEAAAADGDGTAVFWAALSKAAGDATTIEQYLQQQLQQHVEDEHADDGSFVAQQEPWDEDSVNAARHVLRSTRATDTTLPDYLLDTLVVVWGVYGDGTGTTPDYVDDANSTWLST